jgi:Na+:H+ antiporter, NhaA family
VLLCAAAVALAWSNSPFADSYDALWATKLSVSFGGAALSLSLHHWINDGLMAVFFLVVGLEIKRELLVGELASRSQAVLPAAAAVGGAVVPALIFLTVVGPSSPESRGWGVPMATDIAFALGVLALVGARVPLAVRIFVTALAIVDDLLAVLVIALFYTGELYFPALIGAGIVFALLIAANWVGVQRPVVFGVLGIALWLAVLGSGVHATVAGVLLAVTVPARGRGSEREFVVRARRTVDEFSAFAHRDPHHRHAALSRLSSLAGEAQAPMVQIEHSLTRWVAFVIVPIFALANAGVRLTGDLAAVAVDPVFIGVVAGLLVGKQFGITIAAWAVVRTGLARLPSGVTWLQIYGAAWLCGIGFTMSLFIAELAYDGSSALVTSKVGILAASVVAGVVGYVLIRAASRQPVSTGS